MTSTNKADVFCKLAQIAEQSPCHKGEPQNSEKIVR